MPLTEKEQRFLRQTNQITQLGGKLSPAQQQTLQSIQAKMNQSKPTATPAVTKPPAVQTPTTTVSAPKVPSPKPTAPAVVQKPPQSISTPVGPNNPMKTYTYGNISMQFANDQAERAWRAANPYADYTKAREMKFLNDIDNMLVNNQGVSNAQLQQYNALAKKWNFDPTKNRITDEITKEIQAQIAAQQQALQDELARTQQANQLAVDQNNAYLTEQLKKMQEQKAYNDQEAQMLANRRGGFYSGGLDYQLGQNLSSYNQAAEGLTRDIAMRNADIYAKNALLAEQAARQIQQLQSQAPTLIQQRIREELDRQRGLNMQEAQLTGVYNGRPTLEAQNMQFQQNMAQQQFQANRDDEMRRRAEWESEQKWNRLIQSAGLTGEFQGKPTLEALQFALQRQVQLGNLSLAQAAQALDEAKFLFSKDIEQQQLDLQKQELELKKLPEPTDLKKYTDQLNKIYLQKNDKGGYKVTNPQALFDAIIGLGLSDADTDKLINMYGLQSLKEQLMKNFQTR